jgi:oligopeptidase B
LGAALLAVRIVLQVLVLAGAITPSAAGPGDSAPPAAPVLPTTLAPAAASVPAAAPVSPAPPAASAPPPPPAEPAILGEATTWVMGSAGPATLAQGALVAAPSADLALAPPVAKRIAHADTLQGEVRPDDWHWLREKENPEVISYLNAENAYTAARLQHTLPLQEKLYQEMVVRIQETDSEVPYRKDGWLYYTRTEKDKQYPCYCRRQGSMDAPEQLLLDLNAMAEGKEFMELGAFAVSDDGNLLAFSTDETGYRQYRLAVKDLVTGEVSPALAEKTGSVAWAADNRTIFYTVEDEAKRQYRLYRHELGTINHTPVYEEPDEAFSVGVLRSRSRESLFLNLGSLTTGEWRYLPAAEPRGEWRIIEPRRHGIEYAVEQEGATFWITVNDTGRSFRLVSAPVATPGKENWREIISARPEVMIEGLDAFAHWLVRYERENGLQRIVVRRIADGNEHTIAFPEPTYTVWPGRNAVYDTDTLRYEYTSMVTPRSTYDYDMAGRTSLLRKQQTVLGGFDRANYATERVYATAPDGVRVPISLVYRKGRKLDGSAPMVLQGYGAYGLTSDPAFSSNRLSLLDRGVTFAIAHVRGGGEMGKPWHDAGRMLNKMSSFTDFIAAGEYLEARKYTAPDRLVVIGASAGGLLMGAILNMRPDLYKAMVAEVPFVDIVNTMSDPTLPLTVGEFEEWGNPANPEQYRYMMGYSPYDNVKKGPYPALLVRTSLNDSEVGYWEPVKWVAKLRTMKTNPETPLLLEINMGAGHGGASGRYDFLKEMALSFAFALDQVGIRE